MAKRNVNGEMNEKPQSNRWYPLRLGSSLVDRSSSKKFCMLRYEFKPASIDNTRQGRLYRNKENRVSVEFYNNHPGKPKVSFEGSSEDCNDTHAILFLDENTFQLEKLHRAYKSLKHKRILGQSKSNGDNEDMSSAEADSPLRKVARTQAVNKPSIHALPFEVEKIDIVRPENNVAAKHANNKTNAAHQSSSSYSFCPPYHENKPYDDYDRDQDHNMPLDTLRDHESGTPNCLRSSHHTSSDVGFPNHHAESDDDIDIDLLDDIEPKNEGLSAAEILQAQMTLCGIGDAQVKQGARRQETSCSGGESSSSGCSSASTGSWSGSSSISSSDASDGDGNSSGRKESDIDDDGAGNIY